MTPLRIVIQPLAGQVDWPAVTHDATAEWGLITDRQSAARLDGRATGLSWIDVAEHLSEDSIAARLRVRLANQAVAGVRLITGQEFTVRLTARLRERFGVPGPREATVAPFLDKTLMKGRLAVLGPRLPKWRRHDPVRAAADPAAYAAEVIEALGLPVFAKPIEEVGSTGTARLDTAADLAAWSMARNGGFEIDQYLDGPVFNADSLVRAGEVLWFGACELLHPPFTVLHGRPLASWVIDRASADCVALRQLHDAVIGVLQPPDGAVHMEAIRTAGGWKFLEIACRPAGWCIPDIYKVATGVDLRTAHLRLCAGVDPALSPTVGPAAAYWCAVKTTPGTIRRRNRPRVDVAHQFEELAGRAGSGVAQSVHGADFIAKLVLWDEDPARVRAALRALDGFVPYEVETEPRSGL